jgi:3-methyladenine DNA glycosylase AlkD
MNNFINQKILDDIKSECSSNITLTQESARRFFKTSYDNHSANDEFLGITVPELRRIAKKYEDIGLETIENLLKSQYNEERLLALLILVQQYQKSNPNTQEAIYRFYLKKLKHVNNWNLVDSSAHHILGHYLWDKDRTLLNELARSETLWERRISIIATWHFIRKDDISTTFDIAELLLQDKHDLIHKAVGWMLREAGKKDIEKLMNFLSKHAKQMPRTMLRYAMEKFTEQQRRHIRALASHSAI